MVRTTSESLTLNMIRWYVRSVGLSLDSERITKLVNEIQSINTTSSKQSYYAYVTSELEKIKDSTTEENRAQMQILLNNFVDELTSEKLKINFDKLSYPEATNWSVAKSFTYDKRVKYAASKSKIPQDSEEVDKLKIQTRLKHIIDSIKNNNISTKSGFMQEVVKYMSAGTTFSLWNVLAKEFGAYTIPCMIGGIPIFHVKSIEVAKSGQILKFRATGEVFVANQEGAEDGIRVEFLVVGEELIITLLLWILYLYGKGYVKSLNTLESITPSMSLTQVRETITNIVKVDENLEKPKYEYHHTYPFVTRHIIIPNVYIETISLEDTLNTGKNVLDGTLLIRTYRPPTGFTRVGKEGSFGLKDKSDKSVFSFKMLEFLVNSMWRVLNASGLIIDNRSYVGSGESTDDDVYYNIDYESLATTGLLALGGII